MDDKSRIQPPAHSAGRRGARRSRSGPARDRPGIRGACRTPRLPTRGHFVIRNAYVMTMEPGTPATSRTATCMCRDGVIVAVGQKLNTPGATTINGAGMIVLPGLVETHWHMWKTLLRSMSGDKPELGYFRRPRARAAIRRRRHVPGHAARGGRSDQRRHHVRARLVSQHPFARLRASRTCGRSRIRPARALLLRRSQGMPNNQGIVLADLDGCRERWPNTPTTA